MVEKGAVEDIPGLIYSSFSDFQYSDSSANFLEMDPLVLERTILEQGHRLDFILWI
jgi:hypothetical protein